MLSLSTEELFERIRAISAEAEIKEWDHWRPAITWAIGDRWVTLYGDTASTYQRLLSELESALGSRLSLETVVSHIQRSITTEAYGTSRGAGLTHLEELSSLFEKSISPQTVYLPLDGIELEIPRFHIGRVRFVRFDEHHRGAVLSKAIEVSGSLKDEKTREEHGRRWEKNIDSRLTDRICSVTVARAEPKRAVELAYAETQQAIEAITFGNIALYPFHPIADAVIALEGQKPGAHPWTISKSEDGIWQQMKSPPQHWSVPVSESSLQQMSMSGLGEVSRILQEGTPTDLESAILNAVHWLWESTRNLDPAGKAMCLFVALESLVPDKLFHWSGDNVSKGISRILSHPFKSVESDEEKVRRLWGLRSDAVHGYRSSLREHDLQLLRVFVVQSITQLLHYVEEIKSIEELRPLLKPDRETNFYLGSLAPRSLTPAHGCGPSIRFLRTQAGISVEELESIANGLVPAERIRHWERTGATAVFNDLLKIAAALQVDLEEIDLPVSDRIVRMLGHVFLLHSQSTREGGSARIVGHYFGDAETDIELAPIDTTGDSEPIGYALSWRVESGNRQDALDQLEASLLKRIRPKMTFAN